MSGDRVKKTDVTKKRPEGGSSDAFDLLRQRAKLEKERTSELQPYETAKENSVSWLQDKSVQGRIRSAGASAEGLQKLYHQYDRYAKYYKNCYIVLGHKAFFEFYKECAEKIEKIEGKLKSTLNEFESQSLTDSPRLLGDSTHIDPSPEGRGKPDYETQKFPNEMAESKAKRLESALEELRERVQRLEDRHRDMAKKKVGHLAAVKVASELDTTTSEGNFDALAETYTESIRLFNDGDSNNAPDSVKLYEQERRKLRDDLDRQNEAIRRHNEGLEAKSVGKHEVEPYNYSLPPAIDRLPNFAEVLQRQLWKEHEQDEVFQSAERGLRIWFPGR